MNSSSRNRNSNSSRNNKRRRLDRPWDRRCADALAAQQRQQEQQETIASRKFVEINGQRYFNDRFYLNQTIHDDDGDGDGNDNSGTTTKTLGTWRTKCYCGANQPPPLFDRSALVASLDLKAAILATYTLEKRTLRTEFPSLFGAEAKVPTLVLHGRKPEEPQHFRFRQTRNNNHDVDQDVEDGHNEDEDSHCRSRPKQEQGNSLIQEVVKLLESEQQKVPAMEKDEEDAMSVATQTSDTKSYAASFCRKDDHDENKVKYKHDQVHFTEIRPYWIAPTDLPSIVIKNDGSVCDAIIDKREYKQGVHHPKFMLLFETSGSLVVVVSTSNLTKPCSADGTWIQRFYAKPTSRVSHHKLNHKHVDNTCPGRVLGHFLDCQTWAALPNQLTPLGFGRRHLGWMTQSCQELERAFDFSKSQVFLVPHVPGDHDCSNPRRNYHHKQRHRDTMFRYGRQFVDHVLHQLEGRGRHEGGDQRLDLDSILDDDNNNNNNQRRRETGRPWLPPSLLSDQDRLIVQPTSIGGEWTPKSMSEVVVSYLGPIVREGGSQDVNMANHILKRLDIVWPTDDLIRTIAQSQADLQRTVSPDGVAVTGFRQRRFDAASRGKKQKISKKEESVAPLERGTQGCLFLTSQTFNSVHLDCLSRMVMFEPTQQRKTLVPHFKSVARLFGGKRYRIQKDFGVGKSDELLSWFLMTSACLSRGAQGEERLNGVSGSNAISKEGQDRIVSYANFELGVLFVSRLQGKPKSDRIYCSKPAYCSCSQSSMASTFQGTQLVHLPIPYGLRPASYLEDEDELVFCETPFFNEITNGTANTGNMKFTPFGMKLTNGAV